MISDKIKNPHWTRNIIKYVFSLGLSAVFIYIAFSGVDVPKVGEFISGASLFWIVILIITMIFSHYLRALRWKVILNSVKPDASIHNLFGAMMVGYGVNCAVPRLGEISRAVLLGKWEKLSRSSMFGTVILERIIDLIFLALALLVSVFLWSESLYVQFPWLKTTLYLSSALMSLIVIFLYMMIKFKNKFYTIILNFIGKFSKKAAHKIAHIFDMLIEGFASLKGAKNYFLTILLSILLMLAYAFSAYIGFFTVGIKAPTFTMAWVLMSISAIGIVIPTPGGIGSFEAITKTTMVLLFGLTEAVSLAYALLTHVISIFIFIIGGLLSFFLLNRYHDNLIKIVETEMEEL